MRTSLAVQAEIAKRRAQAVQMRIAGVDYETIAARMGYSSRQAARQDVKRARDQALREQRESVEELDLQEMERLDRLQAAYWLQAVQGDVKAADFVLRVMIRRAKYMGTDGAMKVEITTIDQIDQQIEALRAAMALNDLVVEMPEELVEE